MKLGTIESAGEMITTIVKMMVDNPDEVVVTATVYDRSVTYGVHVSHLDRRKLIGRDERSLRVLLQSISLPQKLEIKLHIED